MPPRTDMSMAASNSRFSSALGSPLSSSPDRRHPSGPSVIVNMSMVSHLGCDCKGKFYRVWIAEQMRQSVLKAHHAKRNLFCNGQVIDFVEVLTG